MSSYFFKSIGTHHGNHPAFQVSQAGGGTRNPQVGFDPVRGVALVQHLHQGLANASKLLHMLVAVHMVWRGLPMRLKQVQLVLNHAGGTGWVKTAPQRLAHGRSQRQAVPGIHGKAAGPVQVQAHIDLATQVMQHGGVLRPMGRQHHGTGGTQAPQFSQLSNAA